jgi:hypothetical protein
MHTNLIKSTHFYNWFYWWTHYTPEDITPNPRLEIVKVPSSVVQAT